MKRSTINQAINQAIPFFQIHQIFLPEFAYFTVSDWQEKRKDYDEVKKTSLGWDVTDFGSGDFQRIGRTIFTLRNGSHKSKKYPKSYALKIMFLQEGQKSPIHYHKMKMEDIINQSGGKISICFWKSGSDHSLSKDDLVISKDGKQVEVFAGQQVILKPGESVCVVPNTYHQFWALEGSGAVVSGEVSSVSNDMTDNFFLMPAKRFPIVEEDQPRKYLLCSEYELS